MQKIIIFFTTLLALIATITAQSTEMWYFKAEGKTTGKEFIDKGVDTEYQPTEDDKAAIKAWVSNCSVNEYQSGLNMIPNFYDGNKIDMVGQFKITLWFATDEATMKKDECSKSTLTDAFNAPMKKLLGRDVFSVKLAKIGTFDEANCLDKTTTPNEIICGNQYTGTMGKGLCVACRNSSMMISVSFGLFIAIVAMLF